MRGKNPIATLRSQLGAMLLAMLIAAPSVSAQSNRASTQPQYDRTDLVRFQSALERLAEDVQPSVVSINAYRNPSRGGGRTLMSHGSGFVVRGDGFIVTNHHVIEGADTIEVGFAGGQKEEAKLVQFDPRRDIAVIKVNRIGLTAASLGDGDALRVGHLVFSAGNPFGLAHRTGRQSFSMGVVSSVGRSLTEQIDGGYNDRYYGNLIETDASINPGNSGGPLFNIDGEVVGVATAMISDSGVDEGHGYAIPLSGQTRHIIDTLVRGEVVRYGYLGVLIGTPDNATARRLGLPGPFGAVIQGLDGDPRTSPAAKAGLRENDVIVSFDGHQISDSEELIRLVGSTPVGQEVPVRFYRDRTQRSINVRLAERAATVAARTRNRDQDTPNLRLTDWRGAVLVEPTDSFLYAHGIKRDDSGLYVLEIERDSELYRRGLRSDSLILRCNGRRVRSIDELKRADDADSRYLRLDIKDANPVVMRKR